MIHAYPPMEITAQRVPQASRTPFWDDRQAVRLKIFLITMCVLVAALLEVPR